MQERKGGGLCLPREGWMGEREPDVQDRESKRGGETRDKNDNNLRKKSEKTGM